MRDTVPPAGRRRQRDDRLAALGPRRGVHEVHLPADAGEDRWPIESAQTWPGQVDLERRVDGRHARVLADERRRRWSDRSGGTRPADCRATKSNSRRVPATNDVMVRPGCTALGGW